MTGAQGLEYEIRRGAYYDSVVLMQLQRGLVSLPGIRDAGVVMATPANLDLLRESHLLPDQAQAGPDDLLIVVQAENSMAARDALKEVDRLMVRRAGTGDVAFQPKSLAGAAKLLPEAEWVLVSVPGRYAAAVAQEALAGGRNVFLYSDNVSTEDELALKSGAAAKGLMVMGPDCGTAIVHGVGLGFANRVRPGSVGVVAASGTGLQAFTSHLTTLGGGISQAFGTGSHDLSAQLGARTALQALAYLAADANTKVITLISKPPDPEVAATVLAQALRCGKPVVVEFLGYASPGRRIGPVHFCSSLEDAAEVAFALTEKPADSTSNGKGTRGPERRGYVRGLFSGGTLATELLQTLQAMIHPLYSNAPLAATQKLENPLHSRAHTILDLGDDQFTVGRLHPMLDNDLRIRRLRQEAADPEVSVILMDVVLGMGSHPDPASELGPAILEARHGRKDLSFGILLIGTEEDPQGITKQEEALRAAGAEVFVSTARLAEFAWERAGAEPPAPSTAPRLTPPMRAINVGLLSFYESLIAQGAQAVHVDWRPPAGGNEDLMAILARMGA